MTIYGVFGSKIPNATHKELLWFECLPPPSNLYVVALIPNVIVFGDGVFGRQMGLDEVMRMELS